MLLQGCEETESKKFPYAHPYEKPDYSYKVRATTPGASGCQPSLSRTTVAFTSLSHGASSQGTYTGPFMESRDGNAPGCLSDDDD